MDKICDSIKERGINMWAGRGEGGGRLWLAQKSWFMCIARAPTAKRW